jgi:hypothetical protein
VVIGTITLLQRYRATKGVPSIFSAPDASKAVHDHSSDADGVFSSHNDHGRVKVLDRARLAIASCECYRAATNLLRGTATILQAVDTAHLAVMERAIR